MQSFTKNTKIVAVKYNLPTFDALAFLFKYQKINLYRKWWSQSVLTLKPTIIALFSSTENSPERLL